MLEANILPHTPLQKYSRMDSEWPPTFLKLMGHKPQTNQLWGGSHLSNAQSDTSLLEESDYTVEL